MHELEKKTIGIRERLENLLHLDHVDENQPPHEEEKVHYPPENYEAKKFPTKTMWLAFSLGVSVPLVVNLAMGCIAPALTNDKAHEQSPSKPVLTAALPATTTAATATAVAISTEHKGNTAHAMNKIAGLSATHSTLTGVVDPKTLSASYYWSMTLDNHSSTHQNQEAQMEFTLPKGAVVSRATLWLNGRAEEAAFSATNAVRHGYEWITVMHRDPLLVTQDAEGHVQVKMSPVPASGKEVRLQLGITAPIALKNSNTLRLSLPQLNDSNFSVSKQDLHLESPIPIFANSAMFRNTGSNGHFVFKGNVDPEELGNLQLQAGKTKDVRVQFATRATHSDAGSYILATLRNEGGSAEPQLTLEKVLSKPDCTFINSEEAAHRISSLWAGQEIARLAKSDPATAVGLATTYRVVSEVSGAVVLETEQDYKSTNLHRNRYQTLPYAPLASPSSAPIANLNGGSDASGPEIFEGSAESSTAASNSVTAVSANTGAGSAPMLQGATNGSIGSRSAEAASAQLNTAGTVRTDRLAGLEAVLNVLANGMEILGIAWGGPTLIMGFMQMAAGTQGAMKRVLWGAAGCTGGLATPGCVNWVVSAARDSNLFS